MKADKFQEKAINVNVTLTVSPPQQFSPAVVSITAAALTMSSLLRRRHL